MKNLTTHRGKKLSKEEYEAKRKWTREILQKVDTDVVAFQELWHPDCLEDVLYGKYKGKIPEFAKWSHKETLVWNDHIENNNPYTTDHGIIKSSFK